MKVFDILQTKGNRVHSIAPTASLADVVNALVAKNCGSLLVLDGERLVGIITERDILRAVAADDRDFSQIPVTEKMTTKLITGTPQDEVGRIMGLLTEQRIRHLPIVDGGQLCGIISIGDVVKAQHDHLSLENQYLKDYIHR